MSAKQASIASIRFGLGARPNEVGKISAPPQEWLHKQIRQDIPVPTRLALYPSTKAVMGRVIESRITLPRKQYRAEFKKMRRRFDNELVDRLNEMIDTDKPFVERMVMFWSNHFTVSSSKGRITPALGAFEREVVRPNVFARFEDMLLASSRHFCMINYLDNQASVGPNSRVGKRRNRDLNENLAREILELHTLGVNGGYKQRDVTEFAKVLTGWSHGARGAKRAIARGKAIDAAFKFFPAMHEPGTKTVLGLRYRERGEHEGLAVLSALSMHPATATHIATKLVRHFVADDPPRSAVKEIAGVFIQSGGDLAAVSHALIDLQAAWYPALSKIKTPYELLVSTYRAAAQYPKNPHRALANLRQMGHRPFSAPTPAGWPDVARHWISPGALLRRVEWVRAESATIEGLVNPAQVIEYALGPLASASTRTWVARAPSPDAALAMIFASREFQRR